MSDPDNATTPRSSRAVIAVYDKQTGKITQVVYCHRDDADKQHLAWEGHDFKDVTTDAPFAHPDKHMVCLDTGNIIARVPSLDEARQARESHLTRACAETIRAGFTSSALGSPHAYGASERDQLNLQQVAQVGGGLMAAPESGTWALLPHTAEQGHQVLADFVAARDAARGRLAEHRRALAACSSLPDIEKINF